MPAVQTLCQDQSAAARACERRRVKEGTRLIQVPLKGLKTGAAAALSPTSPGFLKPFFLFEYPELHNGNHDQKHHEDQESSIVVRTRNTSHVDTQQTS